MSAVFRDVNSSKICMKLGHRASLEVVSAQESFYLIFSNVIFVVMVDAELSFHVFQITKHFTFLSLFL